jgi:K+-transporting ATPase A subunit
MNIQEKLEEIKKQPEHIRMRYVIAFVSVSMFFVLVIWVISLKQKFKTIQNDPRVQETMQDVSFESAVNEVKKQKDALVETLPQ